MKLALIRLTLFACGISSLALTLQGQPDDSTLAETKAWVESELPVVLSGTEILSLGSDPPMIVTTNYRAANPKLESCSLSWSVRFDVVARSVTTSTQSSGTGNEIVVLPLKEIDTDGLNVESAKVGPTEKPMHHLSLRTKEGARQRIRRLDAIRGTVRSVAGLSVFVRGQTEGERFANVIRRAAVLCDAPASP